MNLNLNLECIRKVVNDSNFFEIYKEFYNGIPCDIIPGEHYPLFVTIASQLNNKQILDIGTNNGYSALAFSYNNNNVYSYDINTDALNSKLLNMNKFKFSTENLMNSNYRNLPNIKQHILTSDVIFVDIDPHTGILEYEFYLFLKKEKYKGILILDDIYLGKKGHAFENRAEHGHCMYQNLWSKIPESEKICVSHIGHVSGTGIVNFNSENIIRLF